MVNGREEAKGCRSSDKSWRALPEWRKTKQPGLPVATPFPVKKEVADFLPGVQGGWDRLLRAGPTWGGWWGLAGVALYPEHSLSAVSPCLESLSYFPQEPGVPESGTIWIHFFSFVLDKK